LHGWPLLLVTVHLLLVHMRLLWVPGCTYADMVSHQKEGCGTAIRSRNMHVVFWM
jgi:hypothetical protein